MLDPAARERCARQEIPWQARHGKVGGGISVPAATCSPDPGLLQRRQNLYGLTRSETAPPWFRAASDPRLSRALEAVHAGAAKPWTVTDLARLCNMSRATFARVFQQALGQAPMQYAAQAGYSSVYAFATAFRRHHGEPPRRWQQRELAAMPTDDPAHAART